MLDLLCFDEFSYFSLALAFSLVKIESLKMVGEYLKVLILVKHLQTARLEHVHILVLLVIIDKVYVILTFVRGSVPFHETMPLWVIESRNLAILVE
jgi:hypothetical protein